MLDNIIVKKTLKSESRKINVIIQYKPVLGKYHNCNLSVLDKSVLSRVKNQRYIQIILSVLENQCYSSNLQYHCHNE